MIALIYQFGPTLLQLGGLLIVALVLLALADRLRPKYKVTARLAILALIVVGLWGLNQLQNASAHYQWEQEVNLSGNRMLLLKRQTEFGHNGELAQIDQLKSVVEDFEFNHPKTGQLIRWQGQYDLQPLLLDFDNDTPYLAAALKPGKHYEWGCPPYPYVFFKFDGGQWTRIGINKFPARFEYSNVLPYLTGRMKATVEQTGNHVNAYEVGREIGSWQSDEMLKIDRRVVNPLYFCKGTIWETGSDGKIRDVNPVDRAYGEGVSIKLRNVLNANTGSKYLSENEKLLLGSAWN